MVETARGTIRAGDVIVATNGYTGAVTALRRRVIPVNLIIATEELPADLAISLMPRQVDLRHAASPHLLPHVGRPPPADLRRSGELPGERSGGDGLRLHRYMVDRFPQLAGSRITHAWTGNVAFTFDEVPHMGLMDGLHYALGCNGSGVAMMTYLEPRRRGR